MRSKFSLFEKVRDFIARTFLFSLTCFISMRNDKIIRYSLAILLLIIALNAFGGGYYAMTGAKDVPLEWLIGSPFKTYFIPGLFLFVIVGGLCLFTSIAVFLRKPYDRKLSFICGILLVLWIIIQVRQIGYVSWMQPAILISAALILLLAWRLKPSNRLIPKV